MIGAKGKRAERSENKRSIGEFRGGIVAKRSIAEQGVAERSVEERSEAELKSISETEQSDRGTMSVGYSMGEDE